MAKNPSNYNRETIAINENECVTNADYNRAYTIAEYKREENKNVNRDKEIKSLFMTIAENINTLSMEYFRDLNYVDVFDIAIKNYYELSTIVKLKKTIAELNKELKQTEKNLTIIF